MASIGSTFRTAPSTFFHGCLSLTQHAGTVHSPCDHLACKSMYGQAAARASQKGGIGSYAWCIFCECMNYSGASLTVLDNSSEILAPWKLVLYTWIWGVRPLIVSVLQNETPPSKKKNFSAQTIVLYIISPREDNFLAKDKQAAFIQRFHWIADSIYTLVYSFP